MRAPIDLWDVETLRQSRSTCVRRRRGTRAEDTKEFDSSDSEAHVGVVAQGVLAERRALRLVEPRARPVLHGHRAQVGNDAATLHAEPRRRRRVRLGALEDGPIPRHAEVHVDADVVGVSFAEPRK